MPDLISFGLAKTWVIDLVKMWGRIRADRLEELQAITNIFGNPELLARYYIDPDCQLFNPADYDEQEALREREQPPGLWRRCGSSTLNRSKLEDLAVDPTSSKRKVATR